MISNTFWYCYPFLYIGEFRIKPSFLILLIFLLLPLSHLKSQNETVLKKGIFKRNKNSEYVFAFQRPSVLLTEKTYRRTVSRFLFLYLILYLLYWIKPVMGITNGRTHWLITLCENILQCETAVSILLLILAFGVTTVYGNKHQYLQTIIRIINAILIIFTGCTQAAQQISPGWSIANFSILFLISIELEVCLVSATAEVNDISDGFQPLSSYNHLFSPRKHQADYLISLIESAPLQPLSVCISGDWGSGKTSLVNGALEKLLSNHPDQFEIIRINALELDTLQSLKNYVFTQIRHCLKRRGVYTGIGSEYQKFLTAAVGSISAPSLADAFWFHVFPPANDYREERQKLETILTSALGEQDRIIIIVDDIERCDRKKVQEFIFFLKEVVTMNCCIALFLTDERQLYAVSRPMDSFESHENDIDLFYEKFFNYRIEIEPVSADIAIREYVHSSYIWKEYCPELKELDEIYLFFKKKFHDGIKTQEKKIKESPSAQDNSIYHQKIQNLQDVSKTFQSHLSNPRQVVKFYYVLSQYSHNLSHEFNRLQSEKQNEELSAYLKNLEFDKLVFYLAYLEVCFPKDAKLLKNQGRKYFENFKPSERPAVLTELGNEFLFNQSLFSGSVYLDSYLYNERIAFIDSFYLEKCPILELVSPFTTQEEEWFHKLDLGQTESLKPEWNQVLEAVFRKFAFRNVNHSDQEASDWLAKGQSYVEQLFQMAADCLCSKEWTPDEVLSFMEHSRGNEHYLSENLTIMKALVSSCGVYFQPSAQLFRRLNFFSVEYIGHRMHSVSSLLQYIVADEADPRIKDLKQLEHINNILFSVTSPVPKRLNTYVSSLSKLTSPPDCGDNENIFERLKNLAAYLETYLNKHNLLRFNDVRKDLSLMRLSIEDMCSFSYLQERLNPTDSLSSFAVSALDSSQIYKALMEFKTLLLDHLPEYGGTDQHRFYELFERIALEPDIVLTPEQTEDLYSLLDIYYKRLNRSPHIFRKALLICQKRQTPSSESPASTE